MQLVAIIATVILLSTFLTLIFSIAAYFVTRARNLLAKKRKAQAPVDDGDLNRIYFERYTVEPEPQPQARKSTGRTADQWI